ncbi:MAG: hypothetical protein FWD18_04160 [Micrococcales bacterium]|nr:hypothetical protein [Micrococcales bacterium]
MGQSIFVGEWRTVSDPDDAGTTLTLRADGTLTVALAGSGAPPPSDGTWEETTVATATLRVDSDLTEATVVGDRLILSGTSDMILVFTRH